MKLLRHGPPGAEKPGLVDDRGRIRDLSGEIPDLDGAALAPERLAALHRIDTDSLPLVEGSPRLGPPVAGVGKILAIGFNYAEHAAETGKPLPDEPLLFTKAVTALSGPNDPVVLPRGSRKGDWEVELAVVIGRRALYVEETDALDHVAGYAVINDVSEREYQMERGGQFVKGKSFDTFAPFGPWLVTKDEVADPQDLNLWLDRNGARPRAGNPARLSVGGRFLEHSQHRRDNGGVEVQRSLWPLRSRFAIIVGSVALPGAAGGRLAIVAPLQQLVERDHLHTAATALAEHPLERHCQLGSRHATGINRDGAHLA